MTVSTPPCWGAVPALLTVLFLLGLPSSAHADDWESSAYKGWQTASVTISGISNEKLTNDLKAGLALALTKGILGRARPTFYPQVLSEDLQRTRLFLARHGYPYAQIVPRFSGNAKREEVDVVFDINLGPAVVIATVRINGLTDDLKKRTQGEVAVKTGAVFVDGDVRSTKSAIVAKLREWGYARVAVESSVERIERTRVAVTFDVEPNGVFYFGNVVVEGADDDLVPLVEKTVKIRRGRQYSPKIVDDSHKNLRVLDLFRQVRIDMSESAPDTLDVVVEVVMRDPRTFDTLVSYFNDERLKVGARWTHRNLLEKGRGVQFGGQASIFLQEIGGSVWWPGVLFPRTRLVLGLSAQREDEDSYEAISIGGDVSLRYSYSFRTTMRGGLEIRDVTVNEKTADVVTDLQDGLTSVIFGTFDRNGANDWISPTAGTILRWQIRWSPGDIFSDNQFISNEVTGIWYVPIREQSLVALRGVVGLADPHGKSSELLPTERFFSGGANSMRGFSRRRLGPKNTVGDPVGGEAKVEMGVELRFPIVWKLRGTIFTDAGQVWSKLDDAVLDEVEVAVGPGLWFNTAVGPLRLDYAYRLTNFDKTEPRSRWHFSIGPAF